MLGQMQNWPLLVSRFLSHASAAHGHREIVTKLVEGGTHRCTWHDIERRSKQLAQALNRLGCKPGDRIATLAWNGHRHLEVWYGTSGSERVCHTLNPRLFVDQLIYIINHAEDSVLLFDTTFAPLVEKLSPHLPTVKHYIALCPRAHVPDIKVPGGVLCYEDMIAAENGDYTWPSFDENTASSLCYTSGTTGNPKGVLYSHRSTVLHTYGACMADTMGMTASSVILPVVPMFHANAWAIPYGAAAVGCKLVFNGPHFDAATLQQLIIDEGVTFTAAVPTVWLAMLQHLEATGTGLGNLQTVTIGGSAAPRIMIDTFQTKYGIKVGHAWGMTETSPLGTIGTLTPEILAMNKEVQLDAQCKQGRRIFGVDLKITGPDGKALPHDGIAFGNLKVRGPWVVARYFKGEGGDILDAEGWFDSGDVATMDPHGFLHITDRAKDVIKSGGEWISSIDIENAALAHPAVQEAAVIGVVHPKWDERPLLIIILKAGMSATKQNILDVVAPQVAKWWLPDDVAFVDELPHGATGKLNKMELRKQFANHVLSVS